MRALLASAALLLAACGSDGVGPAERAGAYEIAFVSGTTGEAGPSIHLVRGDGSGLLQLTTGPGVEYDPGWSPDGQRLVFVSSDWDGTQRFRLEVMNADGTGRRPISATVATSGYMKDPVWSPDGRRIAYADNVAGQGIYVVNADGTGAARVAGVDGLACRSPSWSPDGAQLAMSCQSSGPTPVAKTYVFNADGTGLKLLGPDAGNAYGAAWSPDGRRIAYTNDAGHAFVMNADGSGVGDVGDGCAYDVAWAPDGRIVCATAEPGSGTIPPKWYVAVADVGGGGFTRLVQVPTYNLITPVVRPTRR